MPHFDNATATSSFSRRRGVGTIVAMAIDEHLWRQIIGGERTGMAPAAGRGLLRGLSVPYGMLAAGRRRLYECGLLAGRSAGAPVISVGNITVGGTGKTPLVAWVVRQLRELGDVPAILSRGYRAVDGLADEPRMLAEATGAMVVVNPDRTAGARQAIADGASVCVLDDGFQHLRLRRDLDIVTIDATCPFGYRATLPRGLLREPLSALRRADAIVLTRTDQASPGALADIRLELARLAPGALLAESHMRPSRLCGFGAPPAGPDELRGRRVWAFCGLGNPEAFFRTLERQGADLAGRTAFNDHYDYTPRDLADLLARLRTAEADWLVTTAKDAVKLSDWAGKAPLRWLEVDLAFTAG
jgi:tetraacyldisaccharide 4'-kinase